MENPLELLKNSPAMDELMKTKEGRSLVEGLLQLSEEFNLSSDSDKLKFKKEFGSAFENSLKKLLPHHEQEQEYTDVAHEDWSHPCLIIFVILLFAIVLLVKRYSVTTRRRTKIQRK